MNKNDKIYIAGHNGLVGSAIIRELKLQGFENYQLHGTATDNWKMLGNTIPTIFTQIIGKQIKKFF